MYINKTSELLLQNVKKLNAICWKRVVKIIKHIWCMTVWAVALNSSKVSLFISLMSCCNIFHQRADVWIWACHSLKISRLPKSQSSHCVLKYLTASCTIRLIWVALIPQIKMFSLFCAILRSVPNACVCKCNEGGKFYNWYKAL